MEPGAMAICILQVAGFSRVTHLMLIRQPPLSTLHIAPRLGGEQVFSTVDLESHELGNFSKV